MIGPPRFCARLDWRQRPKFLLDPFPLALLNFLQDQSECCDATG